MSNTILLSSKKLKDNSAIDDNVSDDLLSKYIFKSQSRIHEILGTTLYELILSEVASENLSSVNTTLLNLYIQPALIEWATYNVLPFISLKLTNKTLGRGTGDDLEASDLTDLKYMRNIIRNDAEFLSERITDFICENINDYPTYQNQTGIDKLHPTNTSYFSGIYLGNGGRDCKLDKS